MVFAILMTLLFIGDENDTMAEDEGIGTKHTAPLNSSERINPNPAVSSSKTFGTISLIFNYAACYSYKSQ